MPYRDPTPTSATDHAVVLVDDYFNSRERRSVALSGHLPARYHQGVRSEGLNPHDVGREAQVLIASDELVVY